VTFYGLVLGSSGDLMSWFDWGVEARIEFAVVTIILAGLLFAKEIVTTSGVGSKRLSRALTIAILPLLALFVINLVVVFLL
jgi:hypothetical protein